MMSSRFFLSLTVACFAVVPAACGDDATQATLSGTSDSDTDGTGQPVTSGVDGTTTMPDATTFNGGSQGDSTGADESTTGEVPPGGTDSGGTDTGGSDSGGSDSGEMPCMDAAECDDGQFCNGVEVCDMGVCGEGTPPDCADAIDCTADACDELMDACINTADNGLCGDGLFCNGPETCDPLAGCQPGNAPNCDDAIACTTDSCDELTAACAHDPDPVPCQDGSLCNGDELCTPGVGCEPSPAPLDCNDLIACTIDGCDEGAGGCTHSGDDGVCTNGLVCDGVETCVLGVGCSPGAPEVCADDGIPCTIEACSNAAGGCEVTLDDAVCVAAGLQFCTLGGCVAGTQCEVDADCDDGNACDGVETCECAAPPCALPGNPGVCSPNPSALNCFDGVGCTNDACVEDDPALPGLNAAHCENTPDDMACNDGNPCNGSETCDAALDCVAGVNLDCDDAIPCTDDACLPAFGCFHTGDDFQCQDALLCNGLEQCTAGVGCEPGPALDCGDDGYACTIETCDEGAGGCVVVEDDSVCGCGLHCDPTAPVVDVDGCTSECSQAACDGTVWQCGNCIDDDGDCAVDDEDPDCFGVCDNNEAGFNGDIPGQNAAPCKMDCYFDQDSGSGNDDCNWSHNCDPLNPQPDSCDCMPDPGDLLCDANIPGYPGTCDDAYNAQSQQCLDVCGPVTPNGCDCFGCCEVTVGGMQTTLYLGSEVGGVPTCNAAVIDDPTLCLECTQVPACLNTCEPCELCFGETELPPECGGIPECGGEDPQPCGLQGLPDCDPGEFCLTGCCVAF
jgi:hypothetical protein